MLDDATDVDDCLPDEVIAFHEAGHAAVAYFFGHKFERASIDHDGDAEGRVLIDQSGDDALQYEDELRNQVLFERRIMAAMAGEIAQRRFAPNSVDDMHGAGDRRVIHAYLDQLDCSTQEIL